tara:strand:+ start:3999 stop:4355 length:357 start_codon:yes stop_codon:yes gene_type:complete
MAKKKKGSKKNKAKAAEQVHESTVIDSSSLTKKKDLESSIVENKPVAAPVSKAVDSEFRPEELHLVYEAVKFCREYWSKRIELNDTEEGNATLEKMISIRDAYTHVEKKFLTVFAVEE